MSDPGDISAALNSAARAINQHHTLQDTLDAIVSAAQASVPGFDQVGISTIDRKGNVHTRAITGDLVQELDDLQYSLSEGPCVDTLRDADVVVVPDVRHEQRWPCYVPEAVNAGLRAQLALKLYLDDEGTIGGLNLYSTSRDDIDLDAEPIAEIFATQAALALGHVRKREQLNDAIGSRQLIGQAIGMVMERFKLDEQRAFQYLVRASSTSNTKLRDIAQGIVDQTNTAGS